MPMQYSAADGIGVFTFDNGRLNVGNMELWKQFYHHLLAFEQDDEVTVGVITGQGDNFCAGDDLKEIRKAVPGSTINDVVITICGGALRRYLLRHEDLPEESLVAWVPINARKDTSTEGNRLTSMTAPVHSDIADPIERLQAVMAATEQSKAARSGVSARVMTDLSQHVPAATQVLASRLVLRSGAAARRW